MLDAVQAPHRGEAARAASIPLAIAWPVAGGVLTTNVTLAAVAFVSAVGDRSRARCRCGAEVNPQNFMRDVAFFASALSLTAVILWHGKVRWQQHSPPEATTAQISPPPVQCWRRLCPDQ